MCEIFNFAICGARIGSGTVTTTWGLDLSGDSGLIKKNAR